MLSRYQVVVSPQVVLRSSLSLITVLLVSLLATSAGAQTQASCQFVKFNTRFFINTNSGYRVLYPEAIEDDGTIVGDANDTVDFSDRGFTRLPDGSISYYQHNSLHTYFMDRSNAGTTVGVAGSQFAIYSNSATPFFLKGSTFTPITMTIGGTTYKKFTVWGINKWGTTVGAFTDASGKVHGFKRFSDGKAIALNFPGAPHTEAMAINDNGTIVGFYSKTAAPNLWRHGFIYNNGQWAKLDYPSSKLQTDPSGISNSNLIILDTVNSANNATASFMYKNGTFKKIVMPNSNVGTYAHGVSPNKDLITGFSGYKGFIATCQ